MLRKENLLWLYPWLESTKTNSTVGLKKQKQRFWDCWTYVYTRGERERERGSHIYIHMLEIQPPPPQTDMNTRGGGRPLGEKHEHRHRRCLSEARQKLPILSGVRHTNDMQFAKTWNASPSGGARRDRQTDRQPGRERERLLPILFSLAAKNDISAYSHTFVQTLRHY